MADPVRHAEFAGSWYPGRKDALERTIEGCFLSPFGPGSLPKRGRPAGPGGSLVGIISPHAGYTYSGGVASNGYHAIAEDGIPDTVVLIAHHGGFDGIYLQDKGSWETPLGTSIVDDDVAGQVAAAAKEIRVDSRRVISLADNTFELQLPFIQYLSLDTRIVPVAAGSRTYGKIKAAAGELAEGLVPFFVEGAAKKVAFVASTDLTHYGSLHFGFAPAHGKPAKEQNAWVRDNDSRVLRMVEALDQQDTGDILSEALDHHNLCCPGAITLALEAMKQLKAKCGFAGLHTRLLKQATSFDVEPRGEGSAFSAVGYASMVITRA
ncbi:MAG: AmmeMemoRadiSam system protein B [Candidatus Lokiarchaeota archaeon]|nr:AmmeMemoRadiSam system protein B [Candidatus Lokiarchaeota archaeon]